MSEKTPAERLLDTVEWHNCEGATPDIDFCVPYATHYGWLLIAGYSLKCYRLNNGQRVFEAESVHRFFGGEMKRRTG